MRPPPFKWRRDGGAAAKFSLTKLSQCGRRTALNTLETHARKKKKLKLKSMEPQTGNMTNDTKTGGATPARRFSPSTAARFSEGRDDPLTAPLRH